MKRSWFVKQTTRAAASEALNRADPVLLQAQRRRGDDVVCAMSGSAHFQTILQTGGAREADRHEGGREPVGRSSSGAAPGKAAAVVCAMHRR